MLSLPLIARNKRLKWLPLGLKILENKKQKNLIIKQCITKYNSN